MFALLLPFSPHSSNQRFDTKIPPLTALLCVFSRISRNLIKTIEGSTVNVSLHRVWLPLFTVLLTAGCSVFGDNGVESAPYTLVKVDVSQNIEVRNYDSMILVSTDMAGDGRNSAFRKLFRYIDGENEASAAIAMTAPVIMDNTGKSQKIAMTAPVLMNNRQWLHRHWRAG